MSTSSLPFSFEPLRPEHLDTWLSFMDGPAFADNREWGGCYCRVFLFGEVRAPDHGDAAWDSACASGENRGVMAEKIRAGQVDGLLARRGGETAGWLHFGPGPRFCTPRGTRFDRQPALDGGRCGAPDQAAIVCFLVAAGHRRQGLGRAMLREALAELSRRGFRSVVARAAGEHLESEGEQFTGPLALYLSEGFEVIRPDPRRPMVYRALDVPST